MDLMTIITSVVTLSLFFILLVKSIKLKVDIRIVLCTVLCITIGNYLASAYSDEILFIGIIILNFGLLILFFHYEAIASGSPNRNVMILLVTMFSAAAMVNILGIIYLQTPAAIGMEALTMTSLLEQTDILLGIGIDISQYLYTIMILIVFARALVIIRRINKQAKIKATRIEMVALVILFVYRLFFLFRSVVSPEMFMSLSTIALGLSIVGLLLFIGNYIVNSDYMYLLPFPLHSLMIYNKTGLLCYIRKFQAVSPEMESKDVLMSGAFTAISALIQETLGGQARIQHINAQQYQIYFHRFPEDAGNLVVTSYGETAFFFKSLARFAKMISAPLLTDLNALTDMAILEPKLDTLVKRAFPYIRFLDQGEPASTQPKKVE